MIVYKTLTATFDLWQELFPRRSQLMDGKIHESESKQRFLKAFNSIYNNSWFRCLAVTSDLMVTTHSTLQGNKQ